jgi:gentisate 1,2-dioxygenase
MIWLDGLDLPLFQHFPVHFAQHYSSPRYPAEDAPSAPILFPWTEMSARLAQGTGEHVIVRYTSQYPGQEGQDVSLRIGAQAEKLAAGTTTKIERENSSAVFHVISGEGTTTAGEHVIDWVKGDTFCVPAWSETTHEVSADEARR